MGGIKLQGFCKDANMRLRIEEGKMNYILRFGVYYRAMLVILLILLTVGWAPLNDEPAFLVRDIKTIPEPMGSHPFELTTVGNLLYFVATINDTHQVALWKSDGTEAGTTLVKHLNPSVSYSLNDVGGTLFFLMDDGVHGRELWKSGGTPEGTVLFKDIFSGAGSAFGSYHKITLVNEIMYFVANDGNHGSELWKSDGTNEGTVMIKDIWPGQSGSVPWEQIEINGLLFFTANDGLHGPELWRSDGTSDGTVMLGEIYPGIPDFRPYSLSNLNGMLFFGANDGVHGQELWRSDGTIAGTTLFKDINPGPVGSMMRILLHINEQLFFVANDGSHGKELWGTDGTVDGTLLIKDIQPGIGNGITNDGTEGVNVNGILFFRADDGVSGQELWRSDGTGDGTLLIKDIIPGKDASNPISLVRMKDKLFFLALDIARFAQLWSSDGTSEGTALIPGPGLVTWLTVCNDTLFFRANHAIAGEELWKSDGTVEGTTVVKDIYAPVGHSHPDKLTSVQDMLFFTADDGLHTNTLWKSNGTQEGTLSVKNITPSSLASVQGTVFISQKDSLWKSDGTTDGTIIVKAVVYPTSLTEVSGTLFFVGGATDELWKSDGTTDGTVLVKEFGNENHRCFEYLSSLINFKGTLFFTQGCAGSNHALWKSDGTETGTVMVKALSAFDRSYIIDVNDALFLLGGINQLWRSDGTEAGTVIVKEFTAGEGPLYINWLISVNGRLFLAVWDPASDTKALWTSDGTTEGSNLLQDFGEGELFAPTDVNGTLFFVRLLRQDQVQKIGCELWKSDGSVAGTVLVKDLTLASFSQSPLFDLINVDGTLLFTANDGIHGAEPWVSDGTPAGTKMLQDIALGLDGSYPRQYTIAGPFIFFSAVDKSAGQELWAMPLKSISKQKVYLPIGIN